MNRAELIVTVRGLFWSQLFGVLATQGATGPHTSIVSFAAADDLHAIVFPTPRTTRKYENILRSPAVSLFVDDRQNDEDVIREVHGIEARGTALEISGADRERYESIYRARHPGLAEFAGNSALVLVAVQRYDIVYRFQDVYVLEMTNSNPGEEAAP